MTLSKNLIRLLISISIILVLTSVVSAVNSRYILTTPTMTGTTTVGGVYASIYNPSTDQAILVNHIQIQVECTGSCPYQLLTVMRVSTANNGTLITAADIPKKNNNTVASIAEVRYSAVNVTLSNADARIISVVDPGAGGSLNGYKDVVLDEPIVLLPNEGLALYQEAAGSNSAQKVKVMLEWEEQNTTVQPLIPKDEYIITTTDNTTTIGIGYNYATIFNPTTTNKTAIISRIGIQVNCNAAAIYTNTIALRRISAASVGTQIVSTDIPKKYSTSNTSLMEIRYNNVTVTASGSADSRIAAVNPCGAANQVIGLKEYIFDTSEEKIILKQGEGITLYSETAGNPAQLVKMFVEWDEVINTSTPTAQNEYIITYPRLNPAAAANYKYDTFYNPVASGKVAIIKRVEMRVDADGAGLYQPITIKKITTASGGTLITQANIPKKNTGTANTLMELRYGNTITATLSGTNDSRILSMTAAAAAGQLRSRRELIFNASEEIILLPGEGIALYTESGGDINQLVRFSVAWREEAVASKPAADNQYIINVGPITGSATDHYNYTTLYNPMGSNKVMRVHRLYIGIDTAGTALYQPISISRVSASSGGIQIVATDIIKKNNASNNSIAEVRYGAPDITLVGSDNYRISSVLSPGSVGTATAPQLSGIREIVFNGDLILYPGEGLALYQEGVGDVDQRINLYAEWKEVDYTTPVRADSVLNDKIITISTVGSATVGYKLSTIFNPATSGRNYTIKNLGFRDDKTAAGAVYNPFTIRRISTASLGTLITSTDIPNKDTSAPTSTAQIRTGNPTVTYSTGTDGRIVSSTGLGSVGQNYGRMSTTEMVGEELVLQPGEGLALYNEAAGDANANFKTDIEWTESNIINVSFNTNTTTGGIYTTTTWIYVSVTSEATDTTNISIYNSTGGLINSATSTGINTDINVTGLSDGLYYFNATANSTGGNVKTTTRNITIDTTYPTITYNVDTSANGAILNTSSIIVNVSVSDTNLNYTMIQFYNSTGDLINKTSNTYKNLTGLANGLYYFNATACDLALNCNSTETRNVTINVVATNTCTYSGSGVWHIIISDNCTLNTQTINDEIIVNGTGGTLTINGTVLATKISITPTVFNGNFIIKQLLGTIFGVHK